MEKQKREKIIKIILEIILIVLILIILNTIYKFFIIQKIWDANHIFSTNYVLIIENEIQRENGEVAYGLIKDYYKDGKYKKEQKGVYFYKIFRPERASYVINTGTKEYSILPPITLEESVTNIELPTFLPDIARKRFTTFIIGKTGFDTEEYEGKKYYTLSYEASNETNHSTIKVWVDKETYRVVRTETIYLGRDYNVTNYTLNLNGATDEDLTMPDLTDYTEKPINYST